MIECPACGHLMGDEADKCPNCNQPRKKTKNCVHCGAEMEARQRKCRNCGEYQGETSKTKNMSSGKKQSNSNKGLLIVFFITVLVFVGGGCVWYYMNNNENHKVVQNKFPVPDGFYQLVSSNNPTDNVNNHKTTAGKVLAVVLNNIEDATIQQIFLSKNIIIKNKQLVPSASQNNTGISIQKLDSIEGYIEMKDAAGMHKKAILKYNHSTSILEVRFFNDNEILDYQKQ